jgi:ParB-like chromosome segregation protein Spo0J
MPNIDRRSLGVSRGPGNFPQLEVAWVKPAELTFYERRARKHTKTKLKKLRRLIAEYGWTQPLIIDENDMVLCGAGRLTIALEDDIDLVPVIRIDHMTDLQKRAYIIADNRIAAEASWDKSILREELSGLVELGYDVELTAFDTLEIDTILSYDDGGDVDDNVELPDEAGRPVSRLIARASRQAIAPREAAAMTTIPIALPSPAAHLVESSGTPIVPTVTPKT